MTTLAIGITGHRLERLGLTAPCVAERLAAAFALIDAAAPSVRLVSNFAEGADRLAVEAAPSSWEVAAVLPMPAADYRDDFRPPAIEADRTGDFDAVLARAATVTALPFNEAGDDDRPAAYARAGRMMLANIDLLVAVWDGEKARGKGGTGEVVAAAVAMRLPVLWIRPGSDGVVLRTGGGDVNVLDGAPDDALEAVVRAIVAPPPALPRCPRRTRWVAYDALLAAIDRRAPRLSIPLTASPETEDGAAFRETLPDAGRLGERLDAVLAPRLALADALAVFHAHRYRSAYVILYLMAFGTVLLALRGILTDSVHVKAALVAVEIAALTCVLLLVRRGRRERWHEEWMEARLLAELLRHLRFLAPLGDPVHRTPDRERRDIDAPDRVMRHLRAAARALGLPHATLDADYRERLLAAVRAHVVEDQIAYHQANAARLERFDRTLLLTGLWSFGFAAAALAAWLFLYALDALGVSDGRAFLETMRVPLGVVGVAAPALGATCSGLRFTGDYAAFARRSRRTAARLEDVKLDASTFETTAASLRDLAATLLEDLGAWSDIYRGKGLALPG